MSSAERLRRRLRLLAATGSVIVAVLVILAIVSDGGKQGFLFGVATGLISLVFAAWTIVLQARTPNIDSPVPGCDAVNIYPSRALLDQAWISDQIARARRVVLAGHTNLGSVDGFNSALSKMLDRGGALCVVMTDPSGDVYNSPEISARLCNYDTQLQEAIAVQQKVRLLDAQVRSRNPRRRRGQIEVLLFAGSPTFSMIAIDNDYAVVTQYVPLTDSASAPTMILAADSTPRILELYQRALSLMCADAKKLRISDVHHPLIQE